MSKAKDKQELVFVYGTLRRAAYNNTLIEVDTDNKYLGEFITELKYLMLDLGGYPGVCKAPFYPPRLLDQIRMRSLYAPINGEVYTINSETFSKLDILEGHPSFYKREKVEVVGLENGTELPDKKVWMYILNDPDRYAGHYPASKNNYGDYDWTAHLDLLNT